MDKKWNLQDIKPAEPRKRRAPRSSDAAPQAAPPRMQNEDDGTMRIAIENGHKKRRGGLVWALFAGFLVFAGVFVISYLTSGAEVEVFPRHREPNVNAEFTAFRTPQAGELSYEIMSLEADGERQVSATGQEQVTEQATGRITVFKTTPGTQRLIKNTRFETRDGKIYRAVETVVVPGAVDGNPGFIDAEVFADAPGEEYNIETGRFTVPGLEDDEALFNAIYAEVASPITGGFNGTKFIIDDTELETAKQALQMELRNALLERVDEEKPAGFVVFEPAVTFTYQTLPAVEYGENLATIKEKARLQIPLFKNEDFAEYIAAATVPGYEGEPVRIDDHTALTFMYVSATTSATDIGNLDSLEFNLAGRPQIIWTYDQGKLATDLLGSSKTALPGILGAYPAIEKAEAVIRPFWKRSFPNDLDKIEIIEIVGESDA